jgi:hypothetical protein
MKKTLIGCCLIAMVPLVLPAHADPLDTLAGWMTGSFSSEEQAASDSAYYDIRLEMVRIWTEREDGHWFYVEQASAGNLERPYRQRVYHLTAEAESSYRSEVYEIPLPLRFAGAWHEEEPLRDLDPDSLRVREGCAVILWERPDGLFGGGTAGMECKSTLRGARYATSEVLIGPNRIESWDRGFVGPGEQVWGAEKGPYVFLRKAPPEKEME